VCWPEKKPPPGRIALENAIHHDAMEVQMGTPQCAKAVDEESTAPQARQECGPHPVTQGQGLGAVIQQHAHFELGTGYACRLLQTTQVAFADAGGGLVLDANQ